jgi:heavy metal translocating P-type ATPase
MSSSPASAPPRHRPARELEAARARRRGALAALREFGQRTVALVQLGALVAGGALHLLDLPAAGDAVWAASVAVMLVVLSWSVGRALLRGDIGVDVIALIAMAGALALGEYLAGAVVALMLAGGNALEAAAGRRARRALTALLERAPRVARRRRGEVLEEVPVEEISIGDLVVVRTGEIVPVDGRVESDEALVDESTLTGEAFPVAFRRGAEVRSGSSNAGEPFELRAQRAAADSAYSALVRLVREAEAQKAPFIRLADRYAAFFLPVTLAIAAFAWALSGDAVRALAVMVVATPCPLILAAPIALVSGISRAARSGIIVKGGGVIEKLGDVETVLFDKTGTLTLGTPKVERILTFGAHEAEELLRLAASLDQLSTHVLADALVRDATARGLALELPVNVVEAPGQGVEGRVNGRSVAVGSAAFLRARGYGRGQADPTPANRSPSGEAEVLVGVDGRLEGVLVVGDRLRDDADDLVARLHAAGVHRVGLVTGDSRPIAERIAAEAGIDAVYAEQSPESKLEVVRAMQQGGASPVLMVGDGVNDAPALALADVGIAMGSAGATVSSETADAVITVDRIDRVVDAIRIGSRSLLIARQSVLFGIGLSVLAMIVAAFGYLPPVAGALLQEGIDVAVILNALRALRG